MCSINQCVFCGIINGTRDATVVLETSSHICVLDKYPVTEGHALAIPKSHAQHLREIDGSSLYEFVEKLIPKLKEKYEPDGFNIGLNDGFVAGQTIPHVHWHIIPRYKGDTEDPTGGVRGVIPSKQTY